MIVKVHNTPNGRLIVICDSDILGKVFDESDKQLNLESQFYKGEEKSAEEIEEILKDGYVVNVVGKKTIALLIKLKMIDKENVMTIKDITYARCIVES